MALPYDTLESYVAEDRIPWLADNIFKEDNVVARKMISSAGTFKGRKIMQPILYAESGQIQDTIRMQSFPLATIDPVTSAEYVPKMKTATLTIPTEDILEAETGEAILDLVDTCMNVTKMSLEENITDEMWSATAWSSGAGFLNFANILSTSSELGGIDPADFSGWKANVLTTTDFGTDGNTNDYDDLANPEKDVYIVKVVKRLMARSRYQRMGKPSLVVMSQQLWELLADIWKPQMQGTGLNGLVAEMGLEAIYHKGVPIIYDDRLCEAQTTDTDSKIFCFNFKYLGYKFNSKAKFRVGKWIEPANQNSKSLKINLYGNMWCSNRGTQSVATGVYTDKDWASG